MNSSRRDFLIKSSAIPIHIAGLPADMDRIVSVAWKKSCND